MKELDGQGIAPGEGPAGEPERQDREPAKLPEEKRCRHSWPDGRRCRAAHMKGSEWCFFHDPALHTPPPPLALLTASELHALLGRAIRDVQQNRLTAGQAYAIGYLAQLLFTQQENVQREYGLARGEEELMEAIEEGVEKAAAGELDPEPDDA